MQLRDEDLSKDALENNWFSASSALRVYGKLEEVSWETVYCTSPLHAGQYLSLDTDHNGMLNRQELAR